ncbi:hypothetical protein AAFJ72_03440 [Brevibacillus gelatini]|uniref:hypothetical protein n=1 Tax=Brevibacillus gelatini TaxID=1655277 RepID=UPI003D81A2CA
MFKNEFLENLSEKERKLLHSLTKKRKDIQLLGCSADDSGVIIDHTNLEPYNLVMGVIRNDEKLCMGRYGNKHFSFPNNQSSNITRVWIDHKGQDNITFHINCCGQYYELSDDDESSNEILIILLHCPDFTQFSLYDGRLPYRKFSHIFTTSKTASENIVAIAYSMMIQYFPNLSKHLIQLEGIENEDE